MTKYYANPEELIEVQIYIDTKTNRIVPDRCVFTQGIKPCDGSVLQPCNNTYNNCNAKNKSICTDVMGSYDGKLPENIITESSWWSNEAWGLSNYIESQSYSVNARGEKEIDVYKFLNNKIRYLLKKWTLSDKYTELNIITKSIPNTQFTEIIESSLQKVISVRADILNNFYDKYIRMVRGGNQDVHH